MECLPTKHTRPLGPENKDKCNSLECSRFHNPNGELLRLLLSMINQQVSLTYIQQLDILGEFRVRRIVKEIVGTPLCIEAFKNLYLVPRFEF